jgi:tetratricopeptide (TPR) repeat protein
MEIPQNILKELEERRMKANLDGLRGGADLTQEGFGDSDESEMGLYKEPKKGIRASLMGFLSRKKNKPVLASTVEAPQRINFNIPNQPVGPESVPMATLPEECEIKPTGSELFFDYLSKIAVYFAIFLTPLFFMNSSDTLGLSKQLLLSTMALVSVVCWVGKIISAGNISWRRSVILWPALLVAISAVFSSFFSSSFWVSFLGDTGRFAFSGMSILSYLVIFYVLAQSFSKKDFTVSVWLWLSSVFVVSLFGLAQMFGKFILPWDMYSSRVFNTIGSPLHLTLFSMSTIPFLVAFLHSAKNWRVRSIAIARIVVQVILAILVDFRVVWISLAFSGVTFVLLNFKNKLVLKSREEMQKEYQKSIAIPIFFIVFSIAMLIVDVPPVRDFQIPVEVNPSYSASLDVMKETLANQPVFGSGLETFPYVYAKFKDTALNQTDYWGVNFNDSIAEVLTLPTTSGIFGIIAFLSFIILFSFYAFKRIGRGGSIGSGFSSSSTRVGIFASWIFILASKFFYPTSLPLEFSFWLLPALFVVSCSAKDLASDEEFSGAQVWRYFFQSGSFKTLGIFFTMMVLLLGTLIGTYFSVKRFVAERSFVSGLMLEDKVENRDSVLGKINSAIISDPYEVRYFRVLAQVLFQKMNDVASQIQNRPEAERKATKEEGALLQQLTVQTINSIQKAITLDPNNVNVFSDAAESYKNLAPLVQGANDLAIQNYEKASELEPINPYLKTQLGQLYLIKSNLFGDGSSEVDAELVLKARGLFEKVLELNPDYANARYFLGLMQDQSGERQAALENFRILQSTNQDNELIAAITKNLENGFSALGYPVKNAASNPPESTSKETVKGVPIGE